MGQAFLDFVSRVSGPAVATLRSKAQVDEALKQEVAFVIVVEDLNQLTPERNVFKRACNKMLMDARCYVADKVTMSRGKALPIPSIVAFKVRVGRLYSNRGDARDELIGCYGGGG